MLTWLYVPGHDSYKVQKALKSTAEVVIIDWEDAVPLALKEQARTATHQILQNYLLPKRVVVRVNSARLGWWSQELSVLQGLNLSGVIIPKVEQPADLQEFAQSALPLIPLIESALGLERAFEIASSYPQVERLAFGSLDFLADIGVRWTQQSEVINFARIRLIIASRAAGLGGPIDGVYPNINDLEGLRQDASFSHSIGFAGKQVLHPNQLELVRDAFQPSQEEIEQARLIMKAYSEAVASNRAATQVEGVFIDPPVARRAAQVLRSIGELKDQDRDQD